MRSNDDDDAFSASSGSGEKVEEPAFENAEEGLAFYKREYLNLVHKLEETQQELQDFQVKLNELEIDAETDALQREQDAAELQAQCDRLESRNEMLEEEKQELKSKLERMKEEVEEVKRKSIEQAKQSNETANTMQLAIDNLTRENVSAKKAVVALEQGNDDLERETRNVHSSFLDMESKHNRLLEEKILLEDELASKQVLNEEIQRLKDEVRDQAMEIVYLKTKVEQATRARPQPIQAESVTPLALTLPRSESSPQAGRTLSSLAEDDLTPKQLAASKASVIGVAPRTPTGIPIARPRRVDNLISSTTGGIGSSSSPSPGGLKRSNTMGSLAPSPVNSKASPRGSLASSAALNRSVNSKNLASLAEDSPARPIKRSTTRTSISSPSQLQHKRQEMHNRTTNLISRLQNLSNTRVVSRQTSGAFQRVASGVSTRFNNASAKAKPQTLPPDSASPDLTVSAIPQSPGGADTSWMMIGRRTPHDAAAAPPPETSTSLLSASTTASSRHSEKSLPSRPGIPSPLTKSQNRPPPTQQFRVPASRPMTPAGGSTSISRPPSRMSARDAPPPMPTSPSPRKTRQQQYAMDHYPRRAPTPSSQSSSATSSRPQSRLDDHAKERDGSSLLSKSTSTIRPESASKRASQDLSRSSRRISMTGGAPTAARPSARLPPVPASPASPSKATSSARSGIPRRSLGSRPQSVIEIPTEPVPPLPFIPGSNMVIPDARKRASQIGIGLPSSSRRM